MLQPNRFMAALIPKIATRVPTSWMPLRVAITTIITLELRAYSTQRAGFWPRASIRSYQPRAGKATEKCAIALIRKKTATATPIGSSNSVRWAGTSAWATVSKVR